LKLKRAIFRHKLYNKKEGWLRKVQFKLSCARKKRRLEKKERALQIELEKQERREKIRKKEHARLARIYTAAEMKEILEAEVEEEKEVKELEEGAKKFYENFCKRRKQISI
jgi:hypothetical protein